MIRQNISIFTTLSVLFFISFTGLNAIITPGDNHIDEGDFIGQDADIVDWSTHPCRRKCEDDGAPRICYYQFLVEKYLSMSKACYDCPLNITDCYRKHCIPADGNSRPVTVINRQIPGPAIEVCEGDIIKVKVKNLMANWESTTIHWHGMNQKDTPYMDGVPHVTQCPISVSEIFTYEFKATESGTHFWHSHVGQQRSDGFFGPLVVRQKPKNNPHKVLYDYDEHNMIIIDWKLTPDLGFINTIHEDALNQAPFTVLINGLGRKKQFKDPSGDMIYTPDAIFKVKQGYKYRFRFVNAGAANCPFEMSIDNHTMTVISTDSHDIEPSEVDVIHSWPGERYDFIVNANQKIGNYWIRYRGNGIFCNGENTERVHQVAILRYEGADLIDPKLPVDPNLPNIPNARELNPYEKGTESLDAINIPQLKSLEPDDPSNIQKEANTTIYLNLDSYRINNYDFHRQNLYEFNQTRNETKLPTIQFNYKSFKFPPFPLLSQRNEILQSMLCNENDVNHNQCINKQCVCTHVIDVPLNAVVELILIDEGAFEKANHPMHLHGHAFRVIATEKLTAPVSRSEIKKMDREGKIYRELNRTALKDTMKVPSGGYTIVRFHANNPGYWFFHCHFELHIQLGLALVFKVGEHEDMLPVPNRFPTCNKNFP